MGGAAGAGDPPESEVVLPPGSCPVPFHAGKRTWTAYPPWQTIPSKSKLSTRSSIKGGCGQVIPVTVKSRFNTLWAQSKVSLSDQWRSSFYILFQMFHINVEVARWQLLKINVSVASFHCSFFQESFSFIYSKWKFLRRLLWTHSRRPSLRCCV